MHFLNKYCNSDLIPILVQSSASIFVIFNLMILNFRNSVKLYQRVCVLYSHRKMGLYSFLVIITWGTQVTKFYLILTCI